MKRSHSRFRHGDTGTRLHNIWSGLKKRCLRPANADFNRYGGRGIRVCKDWEQSYEMFRDWALSNGYKDSLSIDRINNDGNYEPSNCRWSDLKTQNRNRRTNRVVSTPKGVMTLAEAAEVFSLPVYILKNRVRVGSQDLFGPVVPRVPAWVDTPCGPLPLADAARNYDIAYNTLSARIRRGWTGPDLFRTASDFPR